MPLSRPRPQLWSSAGPTPSVMITDATPGGAEFGMECSLRPVTDPVLEAAREAAKALAAVEAPLLALSRHLEDVLDDEAATVIVTESSPASFEPHPIPPASVRKAGRSHPAVRANQPIVFNTPDSETMNIQRLSNQRYHKRSTPIDHGM